MQKSKSTLAFISTHFFNEFIINEWSKLDATPGIDAIILFDNTRKRLDNPNNIRFGELEIYGKRPQIVVSDYDFHCSLGLPLSLSRKPARCTDASMYPKLAWLRGDFRFSYVRNVVPNYDYYWQIEYDCYFNTADNNDSAFFDTWNSYDEDIMGYTIRNVVFGETQHWRHAHGLHWLFGERDIWKVFYPIVRMSGRAIDLLTEDAKEKEKEFLSLDDPTARWPHCEAWTVSRGLQLGLTARRISEEPSHIGFINKRLNLDEMKPPKTQNRWHHPIKSDVDKTLGKLEVLPTIPRRKEPIERKSRIEDFFG